MNGYSLRLHSDVPQWWVNGSHEREPSLASPLGAAYPAPPPISRDCSGSTLQRPTGVLVLQALPAKRLPKPVWSQKMSGPLLRIILPLTVLPVGGVPPNPLTTTTPPE